MPLFFGKKTNPLKQALAVLPEPTRWGTYWLGSPNPDEAVAAIFKAGDTPALVNLRGKQDGKYFASAGEAGVLTRGGGVIYFSSPHQALQAVREALGVA